MKFWYESPGLAFVTQILFAEIRSILCLSRSYLAMKDQALLKGWALL